MVENPFRPELGLDTTLEVLASQSRRDVLRFFLETDTACASIEDVVEHLVTQKQRRTVSDLDHETVSVQFQHTDLPKLVDTGLIEYDKRSKMLRYHSDDRIEKWFEIIDSEYDVQTQGL